MKTADWILEGYDSEEEYNKAKGIKVKKKERGTFNLRRCPKCNSDNMKVIVGFDKKGEWECGKCKWEGKDVKEEELNEKEFLKYLDDKGEKVS